MPILTTLGAACAKAWGFTSGLVKDQYFNLVSLLLPGNGTNGATNNSFLDSSSNAFTVTRNGNTTQGSFSPFSQTGWGNYFNGSNAYLSVATNTAFDFSTGDFTVECWVYMTQYNAGNYEPIFKNAYLFYISSSGAVLLFNGSIDVITGSSGDVPLNSWNHVAYVRNGSGTNNTKIYVNGVQKAQGTVTAAIGSASPNTIGQNSTVYFPGYISNFRIVKGTAVYTGAFTPPTTPLTAVSGTSLLTCQSNRFLDNSSNAFTITTSGSPSVVAFSPFAPTAAYTTSVVGGSGYFDGNGDYLTVANSNDFDTNTAFTLECWVYTGSSGCMFGRGGGAASWSTTDGHQFIFYITGGVLRWQFNSGGSPVALDSGAIPLNSWVHCAVGYNGTTTRLWLNGVSAATSTSTYTMPTTRNIVRSGTTSSGDQPYLGYISGLRFVKSDVYGVGNTSITVPTAPLTNITNTSLLLNFTNGAIFDATAKNDLETVGNAQISTSVAAKWGTGSILFNGTTDHLIGPRNVLIDLGAADFTIELWAYITSTTAKAIINLTNRTAYPGLLLKGNDTSLQLLVASGDASWAVNLNVTGLSSVLNTWSYIAVVRSGNVFTLYRNGTSVGTTTVSITVESNLQPVIGVAIDSVGPSDYFSGNMQDIRITKGYARTITASPTAPFPVQ